MTSPVSPCDPRPEPLPDASSASRSENFINEQESLRRGMPVQRLLGGGMRYDDTLMLHGFGEQGIAWQDGARWLGDRNMRLAESAQSVVTARLFFRYASTCYRFGQVALPVDVDEKRALHARMVDAFGRAAVLDTPATEKHEIAWNGGKLCGWLMRPPGVVQPPVVIVIGGFDGWREEYHAGAAHLVDRGIAAFLADGPGQGETRLRFGLYLDPEFHLAFSAMAAYLRADPRLMGRVAIWGNSLGGFLAARTVTADQQFAAVCINGGSIRPMELPERFPRFWTKVEALTGAGNKDEARAILVQLDLTGRAHKIECPLLQLHGEPDTVFLLENARRLYDEASSADKTLHIWPDGDHCIYNHTEEKHAIVGDWFARRLLA